MSYVWIVRKDSHLQVAGSHKKALAWIEDDILKSNNSRREVRKEYDLNGGLKSITIFTRKRQVYTMERTVKL